MTAVVSPRAFGASPGQRANVCAINVYRPGHWFAKPSEVSALICASHGWINSGMDRLSCPCCKQSLTFTGTRTARRASDSTVDSFVKKLRSGHHERCPWAHAQADCSSLIAFPTALPEPIWQAFVDRLAQLALVEALPSVACRGVSKLAQQRFPQLLALLDASAVPVQVISTAYLPSHVWDCTSAVGL